MLVLSTTLLAALRVEPPLFYEQGGWIRTAEAAPEAPVSFTISLQERNIPELKRRALEVSTPGHPSYGKFLSQKIVDDLVAPPAEAFTATLKWLAAYGLRADVQRSSVHVTTSAQLASRLLSTTFSVYAKDERSLIRASSGYELPDEVAPHIGTIFGLHGIPAPHPRHVAPSPPMKPANVTPAVLYSTYSVRTPYINRQGKNRQAVAEFQRQYMDTADLTTFFKAEVPKAQPGDEKVSKFVGVPYKKGTSTEALLDIEFIMGVAPGVKTEFWEWPDMDFCGDLKNYTDTLLSVDSPPLSNSISYGWQGDLARLHCKDADIDAVDANWAKLAARGISIMISSGDSGSGYTAPQCMPDSGEEGKMVTSGTVLSTENQTAMGCCSAAHSKNAKGWTWTPPEDDTTSAVGAAQNTSYSFTNELFHNIISRLPPDDLFPRRDVHMLNGELDASGGTIKVHDLNGTISDTTITFGSLYLPPDPGRKYEPMRNITMTYKSKTSSGTIKGRAAFFAFPFVPLKCESLEWYKDDGHDILGAFFRGGNPPPPPPPPPKGTCTFYSAIKSVGPSTNPKSRTESTVPKAKLYPSWPASSPWVTAVGATRFVGQVVGGEEMATDQFASGGGFSSQFNQSDAEWQASAVAAYVKQGSSLPKFPAASDFPAQGRATPDVSALGEGFQVYVGGKVMSIGGTSASSPSFAGMVSLLNEARFKAGKPQMGFLNPFLYANPYAFFDVVKGTNAFGRGAFTTPVGYAAAPGWDAATGLGTPHFDKLLAAAMKASSGAAMVDVA